jgi:hypothetical protein
LRERARRDRDRRKVKLELTAAGRHSLSSECRPRVKRWRAG